jgi:hypothetical protein
VNWLEGRLKNDFYIKGIGCKLHYATILEFITTHY